MEHPLYVRAKSPFADTSRTKLLITPSGCYLRQQNTNRISSKELSQFPIYYTYSNTISYKDHRAKRGTTELALKGHKGFSKSSMNSAKTRGLTWLNYAIAAWSLLSALGVIISGILLNDIQLKKLAKTMPGIELIQGPDSIEFWVGCPVCWL